MTQNNFRKEPTFGETVSNSEQNLDVSKNVEAGKNNVAPSLKLNQTPGYTFSPELKPTNLGNAETVKTGEVKAELPKTEPAKAAGFAFSPIEEDKAEVKSVAQETAKVALNTAERVIPSATTVGAEKVTTQKNTVNGQSSKKRRLGLVALLAVIIGAILYWLKPSTPETVEELQSQQGGSLPIEFRPVDEVEAQQAEAQAQANAQAQLAQATQPAVEVPQVTAPTSNQTSTQMIVQTSEPAPQVAQIQPQTVQAAVETPAVVPVKPQTNTSVVYQPENRTKTEVRKVERVERIRPQVQRVEQPKAKVVTTEQNVKRVEPRQTVAIKTTEKATTATTSATLSSVASKTMTVPKGVSLMQVFRDHQLNISDVNAMNKVNNKISNLKVNEKVTVHLDKNNRVVEMSIGSGGKFTRQADGSYRFK